jgi:hypothetical protein
MAAIEPGPGEALAVTLATGSSVLLVLGLLVVLLVRHRRRARHGAPMPHPLWPVPEKDAEALPWGLVLLAMLAGVAAYYATATEFIRIHPGRGPTLFALHGQQEPVYWVAFQVGTGLLFILTLAAIRYRHTVRWALGSPALVTAGLLVAMLAVLLTKARRPAGEIAEQQVASVNAEAAEASQPLTGVGVGAYEAIGWWLALVAVLLLALTVTLTIWRRYQAQILAWLAVALAVVTVVTPYARLWVFHPDGVTQQTHWTPQLGWRGLTWAALTMLFGAMVLAVLPLRGRLRALVAFLSVPGVVGWLFAFLLVQAPTDELIAGLHARDDVVAIGYVGGTASIHMIVLMALVPVAAIRAWRAGPSQPRAPVEAASAYSVGLQ